MRILSVVGARPQFVKLSPVDRAIVAASHDHVIVHTGQHYAPELSGDLFTDLGIPEPHLNLEIGSGSHARQTAAMMIGLEDAFVQFEPDWVLTYGDTNSTLAAAVTAVKLHRPLAHLEAGLRSGNRLMPEEHNRVLTDHASDILLAPTETAMEHLRREGLGEQSHLVGDVMADVCFRTRDAVLASPPPMPEGWVNEPGSVLATIHRAENTDNPGRLAFLLAGLAALGRPVLLVAHPRLVSKAAEFGISLASATVHPIASMTYSQMVFALLQSAAVVTDSGGLQKEAFLLHVPCVTVRTETEWPETLAGGWNIVDPQLVTRIDDIVGREFDTSVEPFGDGRAAEHAVAAIESAS